VRVTSRLSALFRNLLQRSRVERDLGDELRGYVDLLADQKMREGMTADGARRAALAELGGVEQVKDEVRDVRAGALIEQLLQDLRHALRLLRRSPGFAALAILTLAVGIGANTAIFSAIDATLLRPLPFPEPGRLMQPALRMPRDGVVIDMEWSYPKYLAFQRDQTAFGEAALYIRQLATVGGENGADRVPGEAVSSRYFTILGITPVIGDGIAWMDDAGPAERVLLLGYGYWRTRFAGDRGVVGSSIDVSGRAFRIAGVLPEGFHGLTGRADIWFPLAAVRTPESLAQAGAHQYRMIARLRPGVPVARAKAEVQRLGVLLAGRFPNPERGWSAAAYTLEEIQLDPGVREAMIVIAGAVVLVLLSACVNIAGLLLARAAGRRREIAIRLAIGARRGRLVRQFLTESMLLAACGAMAAVAVAWAGVRLLEIIAPAGGGGLVGTFAKGGSGFMTIRLQSMHIDARGLLFTGGIALLTGVLFGLAPALHSTRVDLGAAMKLSDVPEPGFAGLRALTSRGVLVITEIALAVVLLVGSGLVARSLVNLLTVPAGFDASPVLTARVSLSGARYSADSTGALWGELLERVAAIPGVTSAGVAFCAPVSFECEGTSMGIGPGDEVPVGRHSVSPDYFRTLGIPLLAGRGFTNADRYGAPRVILINRSAQRAYWRGENPIGRRVDLGGPAEIIGVVGDVRYNRLEEPPLPAIYVPFAQRSFGSAMVFLRTSGDPARFAASLRTEVRRLDPGHAVYDVKPMRVRIADTTARTRFSVLVIGTFAAIALLLAAIGIYGIMALAVGRRTREIGIRMALGATGGRVVRMLVKEGMLLATIGGAVGLAAAAGVTRVLSTLLYGVGELDPLTYGAIATLLAIVAFIATFVPARRAARLRAVESLKAE
jgi:putative ABC transport system permease protein